MEAKGQRNIREINNSWNNKQSGQSKPKPLYDNNDDIPTVVMSIDRAAELVAKLTNIDDRRDMFDFFCIHFSFTSRRDIERFQAQCKMLPERPKLDCRQCGERYIWDEGYNKDWCCEDCYKQFYGQISQSRITKQ